MNEKAKKISNLIDLIRDKKNTINDIIAFIQSNLRDIINDSDLKQTYKIIFLYDPDGSINDYTADRIYESLPGKTDSRNILLIIHSPGGDSNPAYLIGKFCKEHPNKFIVTVPRKAKSAATLITLGADEIHMGNISQLGPIDPQISNLPVLGVSDALDHLASLCEDHPGASSMFANYLINHLDLKVLGYFKRIPESAAQYAQKLLKGKTLPPGQNSGSVAWRLVYGYKDHSFVIDKNEISNYLGDIVKTGTKEYQLSEEVHRFLNAVYILTKVSRKKNLSIIGDLDSGILFLDSKRKP